MEKYGYTYRLLFPDTNVNVVVLQYSRKGWFGWKTRNIDITNMSNEPKYIQKFINESLGK